MRKYSINIVVLCLMVLAFGCKPEESLPTKQITENKGMNTLGLIGGTSWHSTIEYYKSINQQINDHYGNNTNPPLLVYTLNQAEIHKNQRDNNWGNIADMLYEGAKSLENAGAEKLMFCANTPHKVYHDVQKRIETPIIHIADATAQSIKKKGLTKVCFLGTKYTMTEPFIKDRIANNGIEVLAPNNMEMVDELHRIIIEELTYGTIVPESKEYVLKVINGFAKKGAQGVILGCTEFPLMIFEEDLDIPIFNTCLLYTSPSPRD